MRAYAKFILYVMQRTRMGDVLMISDATEDVRLRFRVDPIHQARGAATFVLPVDMMGRLPTPSMSGKVTAKQLQWFVEVMARGGNIRAQIVSHAKKSSTDVISRR